MYLAVEGVNWIIWLRLWSIRFLVVKLLFCSNSEDGSMVCVCYLSGLVSRAWHRCLPRQDRCPLAWRGGVAYLSRKNRIVLVIFTGFEYWLEFYNEWALWVCVWWLWGMTLTTRRGVALPHRGLNDIGLDRVDHTQLVVVCDGEASLTLQVQEGIGRLWTLWSDLTDTGVRADLNLSVDLSVERK